MAQRVQIVLEDDIDGGAASETVSFALDGVNYEIDLSDANASQLRDDFAKWVGHARRTRAGRRTNSTSRASSSKEELNRIREWGRANGFQVSDRGRVSAQLREAYAKANG